MSQGIVRALADIAAIGIAIVVGVEQVIKARAHIASVGHAIAVAARLNVLFLIRRLPSHSDALVPRPAMSAGPSLHYSGF